MHIGHLVAAVNARAALGLDRVLLVVANQPWQKAGKAVTPAEERFEMVALAVEGHEGLEASRIEIDRGGPSYTADTLEELAAAGPAGGQGAELFLVVGTDVGRELGTWERPDTVRKLATVVVVTRPDSPPVQLGAGWRVDRVEIPMLDVSGSDVRRRVASGEPLDWLVPDPVIAHIRRRGLYAGGR